MFSFEFESFINVASQGKKMTLLIGLFKILLNFSIIKSLLQFSVFLIFFDKNSKLVKSHPELLQAVSQDEYEEILNFADSLGIEDYY